ncbi:MAG TPA: hypothetical protein PKN33_06090 [Phycisphaerae bacterium]|nr:hypothetical protein [Phycisphaerae bacterium]
MASSDLVLILACVWALSATLGYRATRWSIREMDNRWTHTDRVFAIVFALIFGPVMPLIAVMVVLFWKLERSNWGKQEAKW